MFGEGHEDVLWLRLSCPGIYFAFFISGMAWIRIGFGSRRKNEKRRFDDAIPCFDRRAGGRLIRSGGRHTRQGRCSSALAGGVLWLLLQWPLLQLGRRLLERHDLL